MKAPLALCLALLSSCTSPLEIPVDAGSDGASLSVHDLADPSCNAHACGSVPVVSMSLLDGTDTFVDGTTARVRAMLSLRTCDTDPWVDVYAQQNPDGSWTLELIGAALQGQVGCAGTHVVSFEAPVLIQSWTGGGPAATIHVVDGTSNAPLGTLTATPSTATCTPASEGDACTADCQCAATSPFLLCLLGTDGARHCGQDCEFDTSCGPDQHCDLVRYACVAGASCATSCPFGAHLEGCTCVNDPGGPMFSSCTCDSECPTGAVCLNDICQTTYPMVCGPMPI